MVHVVEVDSVETRNTEEERVTAEPVTEKVVTSYADIEGWFFWHDRATFDALLNAQTEPGSLVELGAYLGRSAVIIGNHIRAGERFVVIDLFGDESALTASDSDLANRAENRHSYATLTNQRFASNYLALHDELPEVIQAPSSVVGQHVAAGSARFVHIDASHLYEQVAEDIRNTRTILQPGGVVVFDDYSNPNTPGVACAVWEAVVTGGLIPFATTPHKLYGTWGDPAPHLAAIRAFAESEPGIGTAELHVFGHTMIRLKPVPKSKPAALPSAPPVVTPKPPAPVPAPTLKRSDFVPPVVTRMMRARRKARATGR